MTSSRNLAFAVRLVLLLAAAIILKSSSTADALSSRSASSTNNVKASALPTFNAKTQRWEAGKDAEKGYDVVGTLLRNGPVPTFTRLSSPDDYEQAVFKFQAKEKCDINTAQGNMDAYFENPNDWCVLCLWRIIFVHLFALPLLPRSASWPKLQNLTHSHLRFTAK